MKDEIMEPQIDLVFPGGDQGIPLEGEDNAQNELNNKISDLSKNGYVLLKSNDVEGAKAAFMKILELDENNNYALVGLGDSERKENHFKQKRNGSMHGNFNFI